MTDDTTDDFFDPDAIPEDGGAETDDTEEPEQPETETDDTEEVEHDGQKYRIPKALKGALLMQQDYTRKTQEVAATRQQVEAERAAWQQAQQLSSETFEAKAALHYLAQSIAQYDNVDWGAFAAQAPAQAQAAMLQYQQLQMQQQQLQTALSDKEQALLQSRQQAHQAALSQAQTQLQAIMPDFTADLGREIMDSTVTAYQFTPDELATITDPRTVAVLRDAMQWRKSQAAAKQAANQKPNVSPTKMVRGASTVSVDPRKMTTDQWMDSRRKQLKR